MNYQSWFFIAFALSQALAIATRTPTSASTPNYLIH
jgi:hypothetical protein